MSGAETDEFLKALAETLEDIARHPKAMTYDATTKQFGPEPPENEGLPEP